MLSSGCAGGAISGDGERWQRGARAATERRALEKATPTKSKAGNSYAVPVAQSGRREIDNRGERWRGRERMKKGFCFFFSFFRDEKRERKRRGVEIFEGLNCHFGIGCSNKLIWFY
jgi:hypothetical protein